MSPFFGQKQAKYYLIFEQFNGFKAKNLIRKKSTFYLLSYINLQSEAISLFLESKNAS